MSKTKTETTAVSIPKDLKAKAKKQAASEGRSFSNYITQLLKKALS